MRVRGAAARLLESVDSEPAPAWARDGGAADHVLAKGPVRGRAEVGANCL